MPNRHPVLIYIIVLTCRYSSSIVCLPIHWGVNSTEGQSFFHKHYITSNCSR